MSTLDSTEWFISKPEAEAYLNKVAAEIHILWSKDPMLERVHGMLQKKFVVQGSAYYPNLSRTNVLEFHFEADLGRMWKGNVYHLKRSFNKPDGTFILSKDGRFGNVSLETADVAYVCECCRCLRIFAFECNT